MKKKSLSIILAMISVFTAELTACAEKTDEKSSEVPSVSVNNYVVQASDTTVTGEVISVVENEVTLAIGTLTDNNESPDANSEQSGTPEGEKPDTERERPDKSNGKMPEFDGEMPSMPPDGNFPSDGERPSDGRRKSSKSVEKTGSEKSYIIPVGMTVSGLTGRNTDYKGITEGMVLTLTVNSNGVVCAANAE